MSAETFSGFHWEHFLEAKYKVQTPFHKALSDRGAANGAAASVPSAPAWHTVPAAQNNTAAQRASCAMGATNTYVTNLLPPGSAAESQLQIKTEDLAFKATLADCLLPPYGAAGHRGSQEKGDTFCLLS